MIEIYCLYTIELPEIVISQLTNSEDALLVDYDSSTNLINLILAGTTDCGDFGREYINNYRKLDLNYPFAPDGELEIICKQGS